MARKVVGALGLLLFAVALLRLWGGRESIGWRAVEAEVVGRDVPESVLRPPPADSLPERRSGSLRDSAAAAPALPPGMRVRYRYAAGGRSYDGSGIVRGSREELLARLDAYRPGARLTVYHAPAQPWRSALSRAVGVGHWAGLAGGLLLVAAAVWWPARGRRPNDPRAA